MASNVLNIRNIVVTSVTGAMTARVLQIAASLAAIPFTIAALGGASGYGVWVTITAIYAFLTLADFGLVNGLARLIARSQGKGLHIGRLLKTMLYAELLAGGFVLIATFALSSLLPNWLSSESIDAKSIGQAVLFWGGASALAMPLRLGIPVLTGHQKYGLHLIGDTLTSILSLTGIIVTFSLGILDIRVLAIVTGSSLVCGSLVGVMIARVASGSWDVAGSKPNLRFARLGLGLGLSSLLVTLSSTLSRQGLTFVLGMSGNTEWAAYWALSIFVVVQLSNIGSSAMAPFATLSARLAAERDLERLKVPVRIVVLFVSLVTSTALTGAVVFGPGLVAIVLPAIHGEGGSSTLVTLVVLLLLPAVFAQPILTMRNVLLGTGSHWAVARWSISCAISGVLILLISMPLMGLWGVVLGYWVILLTPFMGLYIPRMKALFPGLLPTIIASLPVPIFWPVLVGLPFLWFGFGPDAKPELVFIGAAVFGSLCAAGFVLFLKEFRTALFRLLRLRL